MSIKIEKKIKEVEKYESWLFSSLDDLADIFKNYYKGSQEINVSTVGGDGIVVNFDGGTRVVPVSSVLKVIKNKGHFNDSDMEENSI